MSDAQLEALVSSSKAPDSEPFKTSVFISLTGYDSDKSGDLVSDPPVALFAIAIPGSSSIVDSVLDSQIGALVLSVLISIPGLCKSSASEPLTESTCSIALNAAYSWPCSPDSQNRHTILAASLLVKILKFAR